MKYAILMFGALLFPAFAGAQRPEYHDEGPRWWAGIGGGVGAVVSGKPAPAAGRQGISATLDAGYRFSRGWGIGLEYGVVAPTSGCGGRGCIAAAPDFAPDITHLFLLGEFRPAGQLWRVRVGAGTSSMCYEFYRSNQSALEGFLNFLLGGESVDDSADAWRCRSLHTVGVVASASYQWPLGTSRASLGVQLRGEAANFAASARAGTLPYHHRALMLQARLNFN